MREDISSPTTTHFEGADHLGDIPFVVVKVGYGNIQTCVKFERTKGPVGPVVKHVFHVDAIAFSFESGRGYRSTTGVLHFKVCTLVALGMNNLETFLVNYYHKK